MDHVHRQNVPYIAPVMFLLRKARKLLLDQRQRANKPITQLGLKTRVKKIETRLKTVMPDHVFWYVFNHYFGISLPYGIFQLLW